MFHVNTDSFFLFIKIILNYNNNNLFKDNPLRDIMHDTYVSKLICLNLLSVPSKLSLCKPKIHANIVLTIIISAEKSFGLKKFLLSYELITTQYFS